MGLEPATVEDLAADYDDAQPLATVEEEHLEMLPDTLASGDFGWRDVEWVVQWYYRRFLGRYPDAARREAEATFGENSYETVRDAVTGAAAAAGTPAKLDLLTDLTGVGIPVASAFLQFLHPDAYLVMGPHEWRVLHEAGELDEPYPDPPTVADYEWYLEACEAIAGRCDCDLWTVYRAIWRLANG